VLHVGKKAKGILGNTSKYTFIRNRFCSAVLELFWMHMFKNLKQIQRTAWIQEKYEICLSHEKAQRAW